MRRYLFSTVGLVVIGAGVALVAAQGRASAAPPSALFGLEMRQFVFFAVLEGCYEDGVATVDVERILAPDPATDRPTHFVDGCPICMPALDAFRLYRNRPLLATPFGGATRDTLGDGLAPHLRARLKSAVLKERLDAIHTLVSRWVDRRLGLIRATDTEREWCASRLEAFKKKGIATLRAQQSDGDAGALGAIGDCAVCQAATAAAAGR